jgi:hypothetical protein
LCAAPAGEQAAERGMERAQLGLRRSCPAVAAVVYGLMVLPLRGKVVVEVPDRVSERGDLRGKQQKRAG